MLRPGSAVLLEGALRLGIAEPTVKLLIATIIIVLVSLLPLLHLLYALEVLLLPVLILLEVQLLAQQVGRLRLRALDHVVDLTRALRLEVCLLPDDGFVHTLIMVLQFI